jgi:CRISPR-associated protein Cas1
MTELLSTLYATTPGTSLHLDGDALRLAHPQRAGRHLIPLARIDHIVAWNGVDLTDDLLHRCATDGRSVTWVTRNGRFLGRVSGPQTGNPMLRLAQFRAYEDPQRRLVLARALVAGKLHNYRQLLLRAARDVSGARQARLRELAAQHAEALGNLAAAPSLTVVLGIEGQAARGYFQGLDVLSPGAGSGRTRRPALDPVNCLLSFGYGMLRVAC